MRTTALIVALLVLAVVVPACDSGSYPQQQQSPGSASGNATGILLNAQTTEGDTVDAAHETTVGWSVVDSAGNPIFSSSDVVSKVKGVVFEFKRADATTGQRFHLGTNPKEIRITGFTRVPAGKNEAGKEVEKFQFIVDGTTAAELRGMGNLMDLVNGANVVILLGKIGE